VSELGGADEKLVTEKLSEVLPFSLNALSNENINMMFADALSMLYTDDLLMISQRLSQAMHWSLTSKQYDFFKQQSEMDIDLSVARIYAELHYANDNLILSTLNRFLKGPRRAYNSDTARYMLPLALLSNFNLSQIASKVIEKYGQTNKLTFTALEAALTAKNTSAFRKRGEIIETLASCFISTQTTSIEKPSWSGLLLAEIEVASDETVVSALKKINISSISIDDPVMARYALILGPLSHTSVNKLGTEIVNKFGHINRPRSEIIMDALENKRTDNTYQGKWELIEILARNFSLFNTVIATSTFCYDCERDSPSGAERCIFCGLALPKVDCLKCGMTNVPEARFCMSCGETR
tara:strand:+ start:739 stop:1797 length:1059 start_codon:yes stop_codon:yes gene_type:complete